VTLKSCVLIETVSNCFLIIEIVTDQALVLISYLPVLQPKRNQERGSQEIL